MTAAATRRWKLARMCAAAAAIFFGVPCLLSMWWHLSVNFYRSGDAGLTQGAFTADRFDPPLPAGSRLGGYPADEFHVRFYRQTPDPIWWPTCHTSGPPSPMTSVTIPLWIPTLASAAAWWTAHRRLRRLDRAGLCPKCLYDRAGLTASTCPECGAPWTAPPTEQA